MLRASSEQKQLAAGAGLFACGILMLTKLDHIVNSTLYGFGLKFSMDWYWEYSIVYFILLQAVAVASYLFARRRELLLMAEAFVLSGTQDLVYFGVWSGGVFPRGQWDWTPYAWLLGSWTTNHQLALSAATLVVAGAVAAVLHMRAAMGKGAAGKGAGRPLDRKAGEPAGREAGKREAGSGDRALGDDEE